MGIAGIYVRTSVDKENTSIDQQKELGVKFCKKNRFQYQIYEDIGKSGFEVEDEKNPFKNRQGMKRLLNDIENKIDKVWVYENSRLSRRDITSFVLTKIFTKHNVTVYEREKEFDMNNPQNQMIQGILTQISQYERHLIVDRTTRDLHDTFNRGIRGFNNVYGYKKDGKKDDGYMKWTPVDFEIENVKYTFKKFLEGTPIKEIVSDVFKNKKLSPLQFETTYRRWRRLFSQFVYTGYSLNTDGLEIFNKFKNCEIDNLRELNNDKYFIKSIPFPVQMVSIEDWIRANEKLYETKAVYKDRMRRTNTEFLTGIIECPYCNFKYFLFNGGKYYYYRHYYTKACEHKRTITVGKLNKLSDVFFFYFYLVYDDTKALIEESQRVIKTNQLEIKEKIKTAETEIKRLDKQIERFQSIYAESNDADLLKLTLMKEKELNGAKNKNDNILSKLKYELDDLDRKFNNDKMELTYYDIKELITRYFENMSAEEKRTSIIKIIKCSQIFDKYIIIDTGKLLFVFNINENNILSEKAYNQFKKNVKFRDNFLKSSELAGYLKDEESFLNMMKSPQRKLLTDYLSIRKLGDMNIFEFNLKLKSMREIISNKLENAGIKYDLTGKQSVICFTEL